MINYLKRKFNIGYKYHPHAIILACYFNPQHNPYRKKAFDVWYKSIKHLNHRIIECSINGSEFELPYTSNFVRVQTSDMLWHKETLLNKLINQVLEEEKYKYIFWLDTDVLFTNNDWLVESCDILTYKPVVQPFTYCIHMNEGEYEPNISAALQGKRTYLVNPIIAAKQLKCWRSFGANVYYNPDYPPSWKSENYDMHGHVGFAWGATAKCLESIGLLFDKALIGGADHIMAHAFANQVPCSCITKSFGEHLPEIEAWSKQAAKVVMGGIGATSGDLYHIWHGDVEKRQYYKRVKEFTPLSQGKIERNDDGFYQSNDSSVTNYFVSYINDREGFDTGLSIYDNIPIEIISNPDSSFDGGQFGGSGAGSDWEDAPTFS
mgnify:CR=1 FL=1